MKEYGIDLYEEYLLGDDSTLTWRKFFDLLSALSSETPLGRIVQIRAEDDKKVIEKFDTSQKRIWNEWRTKQDKKQISEKELIAREEEIWDMLKDFSKITKK